MFFQDFIHIIKVLEFVFVIFLFNPKCDNDIVILFRSYYTTYVAKVPVWDALCMYSFLMYSLPATIRRAVQHLHEDKASRKQKTTRVLQSDCPWT